MRAAGNEPCLRLLLAAASSGCSKYYSFGEGRQPRWCEERNVGVGRRSGTTIRFEKHGTFTEGTTVHVQKSTVNYSNLPMQQGNVTYIT